MPVDESGNDNSGNGGFFRWVREHMAEAILVFFLVQLLLVVVVALYFVPPDYKTIVSAIGLIYLAIVLSCIALMALFNKLQFRMGIRNMVRHRSDSIIAVLGFMIGTSIICSSMAIGDTMYNMIDGLVYESYHLYDEYIQVNDADGRPVYFNGSEAQGIADIAWSINDDGNYIDGISWEVRESASVMNVDSSLFEPVMNLKAMSPLTVEVFGGFTSGGRSIDYDLGPQEVFLTEDSAEKIDASVGDHVMVMTREFQLVFSVKAVLDAKGRAAAFSSDSLIFSFEGLWSLFNVTAEPPSVQGSDIDWTGGSYNIFYVSNRGGRVAGGELCEKVVEKLEASLADHPHPLGEGVEWKVTDDKGTSVEQAKVGMDAFTKLFLVLGTFTIIAGITLIINIFVMLAEERKEEMGISRAVGMRRKHLRRLYLFEGTVYSIASSIVGVLFGILSGYAIIFGIQRIFEGMGIEGFDILSYYTVTPVSLVLSFIAGFTITIATTLFITQRVARLNIVSAIRNTPEGKRSSGLVRIVQEAVGAIDVRTGEGDGSSTAKAVEFIFSRFTIVGSLLLLIGGLLALIGIPQKTGWSTYLGISMMMIGLSLLIRHFVSQRMTFNAAAIMILVFWIAPVPYFKDFSGDLEMFILSGVFMVSSGVLLLVWNTDLILFVVEKVLSLLSVSPAAIKMSISYPIKKRFRTGVTIFMFALIIFTITGMSMIIEIFNVNIESFERSIGGGYNLIGISTVKGIDDLQGTVESVDPLNYTYVDWDRTYSLTYGGLRLNYTMPFVNTRDEMVYQCAGVSDGFIEDNTFGFSDVAWDLIDGGGTLDRTDELVWNSLRTGDFIIMDGALSGSNFFGGGTLFEIGKNVTLVNFNNTMVNRTVIAFTEQFGISGVFMHEDDALEHFGVSEKVVHLIALEDEDRTKDVSDGLRRNLLPYGFYTVIISDLVEEILKSQNAFFDLFNAFLSLGLVIGIVGLGIVTLRSVYERRHEIGMMRAIGFRKAMVVGSFLGESAFISGSGLLIGSALGIILGWILWRDEGFGADFDNFGIPWSKIGIIVLIALLFALASSVPPSFKASRVAPAEALRYE